MLIFFRPSSRNSHTMSTYFKDQAQKQIREFAQCHKNVFAEILKTAHSKPQTMRDGGPVLFGGEDQAWYYWQGQGDCWMETQGAREFLKECLEKYNLK